MRHLGCLWAILTRCVIDHGAKARGRGCLQPWWLLRILDHYFDELGYFLSGQIARIRNEGLDTTVVYELNSFGRTASAALRDDDVSEGGGDGNHWAIADFEGDTDELVIMEIDLRTEGKLLRGKLSFDFGHEGNDDLRHRTLTLTGVHKASGPIVHGDLRLFVFFCCFRLLELQRLSGICFVPFW